MMKITSIILLIIFTFIIVSCATKKESSNDELYGTTWEMEYISGPRIAFEGLYPDRKPTITFDKESQKVLGNNSCNSYSASFTLNGDSISFGEAGPTTRMYCGEGENVFLNMVQKINKFSFDQDGKLNMMMEEVPMMRFKKVNP
ncbi:META domain-containing protein [Flavobacterium ovatum]|uniref:META domain-containing protein n=1 Tax=Flavobacterium ovatum TaxID=1928857 RepID=UPI00344C8843